MYLKSFLPNAKVSPFLSLLNFKEFVATKEVKNLTMNFGPQHPAAHGVLRLVLELSGEVWIIFIYLHLGCY